MNDPEEVSAEMHSANFVGPTLDVDANPAVVLRAQHKLKCLSSRKICRFHTEFSWWFRESISLVSSATSQKNQRTYCSKYRKRLPQ